MLEKPVFLIKNFNIKYLNNRNFRFRIRFLISQFPLQSMSTRVIDSKKIYFNLFFKFRKHRSSDFVVNQTSPSSRSDYRETMTTAATSSSSSYEIRTKVSIGSSRHNLKCRDLSPKDCPLLLLQLATLPAKSRVSPRERQKSIIRDCALSLSEVALPDRLCNAPGHLAATTATTPSASDNFSVSDRGKSVTFD